MNKYSFRVKDLPADEKPREKLINHGAKVLRDDELLSIIFGKGTKKEGVLEISKRVIKKLGYMSDNIEIDVAQAKNVFGLSEVPACQIVALLELGRRLFGKSKDYVFRSPDDVFEYAKNMGKLKNEMMKGLYLDTKNKLIKDQVIAVGTLNIDYAHPREILAPALEYRASAFILIHNHPSGDPTPSEDDIRFTKRIKEVSEVIGIPFIDHIIIGDNTYRSLRDIIEQD